MSLRSGNNKKKGQKHQNTYSFRHNKSSMISRKLASSPLDFLCERCLVKLQWRLQFQKYKPLTNASRCNICKEKKIYKAYRTICESCALKDGKKLCTKCGEEVENYSNPGIRNNPSAQVKKVYPVMEIVKNLKKKYQKSIYRKINKGVKIEYDEKKGIIDMESKEVILTLDKIVDFDDEENFDNEENENENENEEDDNKSENESEKNNEELKMNENIEKEKKNENNKNINNNENKENLKNNDNIEEIKINENIEDKEKKEEIKNDILNNDDNI